MSIQRSHKLLSCVSKTASKPPLSVEAERLQRGQSQLEGPKDFRSFTYIQSGFEFDSKNGQPVLSLSKLADIPLIKHRAIPDAETVKEITIKKESTGEWFASFTVGDKETPEKPTDPDRCVGIDVGILKYAHDTDGTAVESLDLSDERERLERAQHDLSQKERGSANWERQRQVVAERHADLKRKRRDFLHKLSNYYATEYDLVAVEGLDAKELVELPETHGIGRERRGERSFECLSTSANAKEHTLPEVDQGTRRKRARLAASRRTSRCGFVNTRVPRVGLRRTGTRTQRGTFSRGLKNIGVVHSESTPVETALPYGHRCVCKARHRNRKPHHQKSKTSG